jgi:anti-sigma regulatory factor (Ser/Thr protein kinase)
MAEPAKVLLRLCNLPENIVLIREALSGVAEQLELDAVALNDLRTAVTEAANNVVVHAYEESEGPLDVEVSCTERAIEVLVRDEGVGIRPRIRYGDERDAALGIGLSVIQALSERVEFNDAAPEGTEVRMQFPLQDARGFDKAAADAVPRAAIPREQIASTMAIAIAPARLARSVLPRFLAALAARAHFSTDRIADVALLADALAAHGPASQGRDYLSVTARVAAHRVEIELGPLPQGRAQQLIADSALGELPSVIGALSDDQRVVRGRDDHAEALVLGLAARR